MNATRLKSRGFIITACCAVLMVALLTTGVMTTNALGNKDQQSETKTGEISQAPAQTGVSAAPQTAGGLLKWTLEIPGNDGIRVSGRGSAQGPADNAILLMNLSTTRYTAQEAREANGAATKRVAQALRNAGVPDRDVNTAHFRINPVYDSVQRYLCQDGNYYDIPRGGGKCTQRWTSVLTGYEVNNSITVSTAEIQLLGSVIDRASQAGGNDLQIHGVRLTIKDNVELRNQAMLAAISDMREKAAIMAQGAGVGLGALVTMTENQGSFSPYREFAGAELKSGMEGIMSAAEYDRTEILTGELSVSVTVNGVYKIDRQ